MCSASRIFDDREKISVRIPEPHDLRAIGRHHDAGHVMYKTWEALPYDAARIQDGNNCVEVRHRKTQDRVSRGMSGRYRRHAEVCAAYVVNHGPLRSSFDG